MHCTNRRRQRFVLRKLFEKKNGQHIFAPKYHQKICDIFAGRNPLQHTVYHHKVPQVISHLHFLPAKNSNSCILQHYYTHARRISQEIVDRDSNKRKVHFFLLFQFGDKITTFKFFGD